MAVVLADLVADLERALDSGDPERIISVRRTLGDGFPGTEEGAEANYRLGLAIVLSGANLEEGVDRLRRAAKAKVPRWTPHARTSLGLVLFQQGKLQQAVFELRRAASGPPTIAAAQALGYIGLVLDQSGKDQEARRARKDQLDALVKLSSDQDPEVSSVACFMLGMERKHDGDRAGACALLQKALDGGGLDDGQAALAQKVIEEP